MSLHHYILNRFGEPVVCEDLLEWARWFEIDQNRFLERTDFPDGTWVSTVFLSLDHNFGDGPPVLWETMIFANSSFAEQFDGEQRRYTSKADALAGHKKLCDELAVGLRVN